MPPDDAEDAGAWLDAVWLAAASSEGTLFAGKYTFPPMTATTMITPAAAASFQGNADSSLDAWGADGLE